MNTANTYIHTYKHTGIEAAIHPGGKTYRLTYIRADSHTNIQYIHTVSQSHIWRGKHKYIHT